MSLSLLAPLCGAVGALFIAFASVSASGLLRPALAQSPAMTTVEMGRAEALGMAQKALAVGRHDLTKQIATALLAVNPSDASARLLLAAAETGLGDTGASLEILDQTLAAAPDDRTRFEATYLKAAAHSQAGHKMRAQFYLRRANDLAPNDAAKRGIRQSYAQLANASRLRLRADLSFGPSRNLNGGSQHDSIAILPGLLLPLPQALSGLSYGGAARFSYRLTQTQRALVEVDGGLRYHGAVLSDKARAIAPSVRNRDLAFAALDIGMTRRWAAETSPMAYSLGARITKNWYGGDALSDQLRLDASVTRLLSENQLLIATLSAEVSRDANRSTRDTDSVAFATRMIQGTENAGKFDFGLSMRRVDSTAPGLAHNAQALQLGWEPPPIAGKLPTSFGLLAERRDYYLTPALPADVKLQATATVSYPALNYMGFAPQLDFNATRIKSTYKPRDTMEFGVNLGLRSVF